MAELITPVVEKVIAVLKERTPSALGARESFVDYGKEFTGVVANFPSVWVMPVRTSFDAELDGRRQAHQVKVTMAVTGSEPDEVTDAAMAYMKAVDTAIAASWPADWVGAVSGGQVLRVFVEGHDYGPLFGKEGGLARFPELDLVVEVMEN
jgi:hypothetical protein